MSTTKRPVMWSTISHACVTALIILKDYPFHSSKDTLRSCTLPISGELPAIAIRDWLFDNNIVFELFGIYAEGHGWSGEILTGICFEFANEDDRFLFALRWL